MDDEISKADSLAQTKMTATCFCKISYSRPDVVVDNKDATLVEAKRVDNTQAHHFT